MSVTTTFHDLHRPGTPLVLPNAWDFATAAALVQAGFPAIATTSLGVSAANGSRDGAGLVRAEQITLARKLTRLDTLFTVDIEAGYSDDPAAVADLVAELADAGAAGVNIEDGGADGTLTDPGLHAAKVTAVKQRVPSVFVNARTDTHWAGDSDIAEAIRRANRYVAAGADGVFVPGIVRPDEIKAVIAEVPVPLNVLFLPGRHTVAELADLGVARISTGGLLFRVALGATVAAAQAVRDGQPITGPVPGYAEIQALTAE